MGLRTKFNLVLILSFGIGIGLSGYLAYGLLRDNARRFFERECVPNPLLPALATLVSLSIAPL